MYMYWQASELAATATTAMAVPLFHPKTMGDGAAVAGAAIGQFCYITSEILGEPFLPFMLALLGGHAP